MGRYVNSTGTTTTPYTTAAVVSTAGSSTLTIPAGVTQAKIIAIGAGSCYRETSFTFRSSGCYSGVSAPRCDYCLTGVFGLPGAGGGYSESTVSVYPGQILNINVGSIGGLSASSVTAGSTTITAYNATETAVSWNCTSNSTARSSSADNPVQQGWILPVCGYCNSLSGYFNAGGTASGGDINRTGGKGILIPYYCYNSCMDACVTGAGAGGAGGGGYSTCMRGCTSWSCQNSGYDYSFGGTRYNCNCSNGTYYAVTKNNGLCGSNICASMNCMCLATYHTTFGGQCYYQMPWASCLCQSLWSNTTLCVSNPSAYNVSNGVSIRYLFAGAAQRLSTGAFAKDPIESLNEQFTMNAESQAIGIGAESGRSDGNGLNAMSEVQTQIFSGSSGASGSGSDLGCYGSGALMCCISYNQDHFTFIFGTNLSQWPWAGFCSLGIAGTGAQNTSYKCFTMGYVKDSSLQRPTNGAVIPLSQYKSTTGGTVADIKYGYGATLNAPGYGGGGNRTNTAGGSGVVVVIY
jgi:hypothetical protein